MFESLRKKKLLILGGIKRTCFVVERAKAMGVYTIVADYYEDSPAKKIADEALLISAVDVDALTTYCQENHVDGIFTAYVDILMPVCMKVAYNLGLSTCFTEDVVMMSIDKIKFKKACNKYDIPVPKTYKVEQDTFESDINSLEYPVFVKPMDGSGSRGANVCFNESEFRRNYAEAIKWSKKGGVVVEEYLTGTDIGLDYIVIDGEPHLMSMWDRYIRKGRSSAINHADLQLFPSLSLDVYRNEIDGKVRSMFKAAGFKNGVAFIQGYSNNGRMTFFEMGCRLGGTWSFIDEYYHGVNPIDMLICHSLTGRMIDQDHVMTIDPSFGGKKAAVMSYITEKKEGRINQICGIDKIKEDDNVLNFWKVYKEGEFFSLGSQPDTAICRLQLVAEDTESLEKTVNTVNSNISVLNENGMNILCPFIDVDKILCQYN